MNATKILLPVAAFALAGLAALAMLDSGSYTPPDPGDEVITDSGPESPEDPAPTFVGDGGADPITENRPPHDPSKGLDSSSGFGMISGRVAVSTTLIERLNRYVIIVEEDVNMNARSKDDPPPFKKAFPLKTGRGTPFFDVEGIPFSNHPYRVTVVAEGMNGSFGITHISEETPAGSREVQLSLTPGVYFSIMVRDQRQNPRPDLIVHLIPTGESVTTRTPMQTKTSSRGQALFENVLQGDWEIRIGAMNAPMAEPHKVRVYASFTPRDLTGKPRAQGAMIVVPDGDDVTVEVTTAFGYAIEGEEVKIMQLEIKRYFEFKAKTDAAGRAVFENIPFGKYQLSVGPGRNGRRDIRFSVIKGTPTPVQSVKMPK